VDTYIRAGTYARLPPLPYTPGTDGAGIVDAVGTDVVGLAPGDRVYIGGQLSRRPTGTYAEAALVPAIAAHALPASLSFAQGAAVGVPYATAWRALFQKALVLPGEVVLVHGASGGVGIAAVQMANAHGAIVIGTAGTDAGRELVRSEGAHQVVDHTAGGYVDEILAFTGGRGVNVVLEMLANVNLERSLGLLAMRGRVVVIGSRGSLDFNPRLTMAKEATVLGMTLWNMTAAEDAAVQAGVSAALESGTLRPVVGREFALVDAPLAHQAVVARGAHGKVVLVP
jgi:NADPH2:quinone reductase